MIRRAIALSLPTASSLLIVILLASPVSALLAEVSLVELVKMSNHVVQGRVLNSQSQWNEDSTQIYTTVTLFINEKYSGTLADSTVVTVVTPGGAVDGLAMEVEHAPVFQVDQEVIVFLTDIGAGRYRVSGWEAGKFTIRDGRIAENGLIASQFRSQVVDAIKLAGAR